MNEHTNIKLVCLQRGKGYERNLIRQLPETGVHGIHGKIQSRSIRATGFAREFGKHAEKE